MASETRDLYIACIKKQLDEIDLLCSIYCTKKEMQIIDPGVISDFNEFLQKPKTVNVAKVLAAHLEFIINLSHSLGFHSTCKQTLEVRIELPHLYPQIENAIVTVQSPSLSREKEVELNQRIEQYIETMEKDEPYIYQVVTWIQDKIDEFLKYECAEDAEEPQEEFVQFERLWIYSHHIKSKTKRQEIFKLSRTLGLSGFCRPGKPGIICVEGLLEQTQEFWRVVKAMRWQKISICKSEVTRRSRDKISQLRRFEGFKEQLFCGDLDDEESVMDMGSFVKYLEAHNSGYMKTELFGFK